MPEQQASPPSWDREVSFSNHPCKALPEQVRLALVAVRHDQNIDFLGFMLVDYLFVDPDQRQTLQTDDDPAISGETTVEVTDLEPIAWSPEKVIARRTAQELADGQTVNLGFGISALVPYILLEEGLDGSVTWVIEQGAVGGLSLLGFQFGCAVNAQALVPSPDQFTYFQGAGFDQAMPSFLEIDREGNVNVSRIAARLAITAGTGGFMDITAHARNIVFSGPDPPVRRGLRCVLAPP